MKSLISILALIALIIALGACQQDKDFTFVDERDGNEYEYIRIGDDFWMKENLRYKPESGIYWAYGDNEAKGDTIGFHYDWQRACEVCPDGWHLPGKAEWDELITNLGGIGLAGSKMKDTISGRWTGYNDAISNSSGFTALPEGVRRYNGLYSYYNKYAYFWSSDNGAEEIQAWCYALDGPQKLLHQISWNKNNALNVRCVKDK